MVDHLLLVTRSAADAALGVVAAHQVTASEVGQGIQPCIVLGVPYSIWPVAGSRHAG
jgi:hypothetical protein